jgi:PKD domain-containing protein
VLRGTPVELDAAASMDLDGSISSYAWDFGDRAITTTAGPRTSHSYARPGTYDAAVTLTDDEGCSASLLFTGQTAFCNGSTLATATVTVRVTLPSNDFSIGKLQLNRRNGTGKLFVLVPGPGLVHMTGRGLAAAKRAPGKAGKVVLVVRPTGATKRALARRGTVTRRAKVTFTPTDGAPAVKARRLKLAKAR